MINLIPESHQHERGSFNLAPMIDFLFLMLAVFATLAVTRATLFDTKLDLVRFKKDPYATFVHPKTIHSQINLSISSSGEYKWITDIHDYFIENTEHMQKELLYQYRIGVLPEEKAKTQILLHIDKRAPWEKVANLIFAVREIGFDAHPIYEPEMTITLP